MSEQASTPSQEPLGYTATTAALNTELEATNKRLIEKVKEATEEIAQLKTVLKALETRVKKLEEG